MKYLLALLPLIILLSCVDYADRNKGYPKYTIGSYHEVPDSNKVKMAEWITKTVSAGSFRMSTCDYEDPEDLVEECTESAEKIFKVKQFGLYKYETFDDESAEFIPFDELTKSQKQILDSLRNN